MSKDTGIHKGCVEALRGPHVHSELADAEVLLPLGREEDSKVRLEVVQPVL